MWVTIKRRAVAMMAEVFYGVGKEARIQRVPLYGINRCVYRLLPAFLVCRECAAQESGAFGGPLWTTLLLYRRLHFTSYLSS